MKIANFNSSIVGLLCLLTGTSQAYKILFFSLFSSKSHIFVLGPVAEELAKRGHQVTFISSIPETNNLVNVTHVFVPAANVIMNDDSFNFFMGDAQNSDVFEKWISIVEKLTEITYEIPLVMDLIRNPYEPKTNAPRFDLIVIDLIFNHYALPIAHHLGIPNAIISTGSLFQPAAWSLDIPVPISYVPMATLALPSQMSFQQRSFNLFVWTMMMRTVFFDLYPRLEKIISRHLPNSPPLASLARNVSFVIANEHPGIVGSKPTMPYYVQLGGLHIKPQKKLPKELEDYMESSGEQGVVYFSLGSYTKGSTMPNETKHKLIEAFSRIPQKVLWKNEADIPGVSSNVKVTPWAPQQDLLVHPKLKLFITHGGALSTQEAIYSGCPLLGFPLSADQEGNMAQAEEIGVAMTIRWRTFTSEELVSKITTMIKNQRYRENAQKYSAIVQDQPQNPVETAAYWLEYVIRHNGASHLKSGASQLNFFQYFLLDIIGLVAAVLLLSIVIILWVLKTLWRLMCKGKQTKKGSKQKEKHN